MTGWILTGVIVAITLIIVALIRVGRGSNDVDPYNGDGW